MTTRAQRDEESASQTHDTHTWLVPPICEEGEIARGVVQATDRALNESQEEVLCVLIAPTAALCWVTMRSIAHKGQHHRTAFPVFQ